MTLFRNTAEGGTNGAGVTFGNSGGTSGDQIRVNITGAGSTLTYSTDHPTQGAMGFKHLWVAGGQACGHMVAGVSSTNWSHSFDFRFDAALVPSGSHELLDVWNVGGDHVFKLFVNPDGTIRGRMRNAVSNTAALASTAGSLVADTDYRLDYVVIPGTGVADGTLKWRICLQGSNTPITGMNISSTVMDAGTTAIVDAYWGAPENHAAAGVMYTDDIRWNDAAGGAFLGAFVPASNTPPTVAAITKVLTTQGQTVSSTMVATDVDGTIATYQWTALSWPPGAASPSLTGAATATFTSSALTVPGIYTFGALVIDNLGAASTQQVFRVGVAASDSTAAVRGIRSNAGGYSGTPDDVNDTSVATGIISPSGPAGATIILDMDPIKTTDISFDFVQADLEPDASGVSCTLQVDIISGTGTTVAATRTFTITDTSTNYPIALTSGENTALADRIDWAVRLISTQI